MTRLGRREATVAERCGAGIEGAATGGEAVGRPWRVAPRRREGEDSHPPRWFWSFRTDVAVEVPIAAADTAAPGEYQYGVTVVPGAGSERAVHEEFDLTVTEG